jgi:tripartite-type tricarboxylate transporter receptor subunit TctC
VAGNWEAIMKLARMKLARRKFLRLAAGAAVLPIGPRIAQAQAYPARPARIIVPFAAGGGTDITARVIGQWLSDRLGQQFIIENRPGGGTNIGTEAAAKATADGYTLLMIGTSNTANVSLYDKLNFDLIRDFAPVGGVIRAPHVVVVNLAMPVKTIPEFISYTKTNPTKVNMASAGNGTAGHLGGELFKMLTGVNMQHVPYRGGGPALLDLIAGQVQVYFAGMPEAIEYVRTGKVRALAVGTAARTDALPDIPTVGESVPGYDSSIWFGVSAPRGTPVEIIDQLNREINAGLADPAIKARYAELGSIVFPTTPAEFGRFIATEIEKWDQVVRFANMKPE